MRETAGAIVPWNIDEAKGFFAILAGGDAMQTAVMRLQPGEHSGSLRNEHPDSEQMLLVFQGEVQAEVGDKTFTIRAGDSLIVPRHAPHRFLNTGNDEAVTFNVYSPPAYER